MSALTRSSVALACGVVCSTAAGAASVAGAVAGGAAVVVGGRVVVSRGRDGAGGGVAGVSGSGASGAGSGNSTGINSRAGGDGMSSAVTDAGVFACMRPHAAVAATRPSSRRRRAVIDTLAIMTQKTSASTLA
jgi:hypothetical protein